MSEIYDSDATEIYDFTSGDDNMAATPVETTGMLFFRTKFNAYTRLLLAIKPWFSHVICIKIIWSSHWKFTISSLLLLYLVDITDHEALLSLLLGAADVPQQRPQQKAITTQPVHRDVQTE